MNKARKGAQWYARTIHCPGDTGGVAQSPSHPESPYARGTRSYTMSRIRGKDTSIEKTVRSYLFARGFRFRKNDKRYPGHPDIVLPKYRTIVFVNGCFWHMHEGCESFHMPKSNVEFWAAKLTRNRDRDRRVGMRAARRRTRSAARATCGADCGRGVDLWGLRAGANI